MLMRWAMQALEGKDSTWSSPTKHEHWCFLIPKSCTRKSPRESNPAIALGPEITLFQAVKKSFFLLMNLQRQDGGSWEQQFFDRVENVFFVLMCKIIMIKIPIFWGSFQFHGKDAAAKVLKSKRPNLTSLLTAREKGVIKTLRKVYRKRFKSNPDTDPDLCIYLGDSASRKCWTGSSGRIPTLRMAGGLTWSMYRKRPLTGREKLLTLDL